MILKTLSPVSFGRFQNLELPLARGVNLIEAPNEAGKSTLAAFVSGMLYGFYKRDVKKRLYAGNYERYLPWDNPGKYFGAMVLFHEGREYRLERNFLKDDVKLFEAETGRDVSERMPYNASLRIREPGHFFLGISQTAFEGTLYVPQQAVRAGDDLGQELRDRIDALSETGSGGLSASGAVRWLNERREAIGTPRKGASPLGEQHKKLAALAEEREDSQRKRMRAEADAQRERELKQEIEALEAAERQDAAALEQAGRYVRWKRAETARTYRARVLELEEMLRALPEDTALSEAQLESARQDAQYAENLNGHADDLARKLEELAARMARARSEVEATGLNPETYALSDALERADERLTLREGELAARLEAVENARRALPPAPAVQTQRAMELMARYEALPLVKTARTAMAIGMIFAALTLMGFLYPLAFLSVVPAAALLAFGIVRNGAYRRVTAERDTILGELRVSSPQDFPALKAALEGRTKAERALEAANDAFESAEAALEEATQEFSGLLERAGMDSLIQYREACVRYKAAQDLERDLTTQQTTLSGQLDGQRGQAASLWHGVCQALEAAGLETPADGARAVALLSQRLREMRDRRDVVGKLDSARKLLAECLGGDDFEKLVTGATPAPEPAEAAETLAARIQARTGRGQALSQELAACKARRDAIEDACRTVSEISGEAMLVQEKIDRLTREAEAIDEAKARIERASDDMRRKLSPALGRAIALVSGKVTQGRYDQLRIDPDLKVQALAQGQTVSPDRLSGGTADAIYLALRLGLIEFLMGDRECPVILDDSLTQLDDGRAARMLEVIAAFAGHRQTLLLTCQSRTRRMLKELQIPHEAVVL